MATQVVHYHRGMQMKLQLLEKCPRKPESRLAILEAASEAFKDSLVEIQLGVRGVRVKLALPIEVTPEALQERKKALLEKLAALKLDD
jgi:hypothetical protein